MNSYSTHTPISSRASNDTIQSNHPIDAHITIHCQDWATAQDSNTHLQDTGADCNTNLQNTGADCNTNLQDNYTYHTPLRIVQTVLNISNQYNNNQTDIEQCNNNNSTSSCNHLQRRFSEPIYIDNSNIQNTNNPDTSDNNIQNNIQNNICTRHHHRRNSIAIKFNKPLYKKFI